MAFPFLLIIHTFLFFLVFVVKNALTPHPVCWETKHKIPLLSVIKNIHGEAAPSDQALFTPAPVPLWKCKLLLDTKDPAAVKAATPDGREAPRISNQKSTVPCRATTI